MVDQALDLLAALPPSDQLAAVSQIQQKVIDARVKDEMRKILAEIQSGEFAREWIAEDDAGRPNFTKLQQQGEDHPIEQVGRKLRGMMSWVDRPITETA